MRATPLEVLSLLSSTQRSPRWMARCSAAEDVGERSSEDWTVRYVYDLPWPLRDRDGVLRFEAKEETSGTIQLIFGSLPDAVPVRPVLDRDKGICGMWELIPRGEHDTYVVYYVSSKEDLGLPLWLTDPIVLPMLAGSLDALANLLEERDRTR